MLISCRHYVSLATDAREGALSGWDKARFGFHGAVCPHCRRYEKTLNATLEILRNEPRESPSDEQQAELLAALKASLSNAANRDGGPVGSGDLE
jgi:hypothetical protein